jgi:hypothetical protein
MTQASTPREGIVTKVHRRENKNGAPMRVLVVCIANGEEERVSIFEAADVKNEVAEGDSVAYDLYRRGTYVNGKRIREEGTCIENCRRALGR